MPYAKTVVAALATGAVALQAAFGDYAISGAEWVTIAMTTLAALGVYVTPNKPPAPGD